MIHNNAPIHHYYKGIFTIFILIVYFWWLCVWETHLYSSLIVECLLILNTGFPFFAVPDNPRSWNLAQTGFVCCVFWPEELVPKQRFLSLNYDFSDFSDFFFYFYLCCSKKQKFCHMLPTQLCKSQHNLHTIGQNVLVKIYEELPANEIDKIVLQSTIWNSPKKTIFNWKNQKRNNKATLKKQQQHRCGSTQSI